MERLDPTGMERIELAIATLTSTVQGLLGGGRSPGEIAPDWGGLRAKEKAEAAAREDPLERARQRHGTL